MLNSRTLSILLLKIVLAILDNISQEKEKKKKEEEKIAKK